jgi:tRNA-binding EMAP/Myf-like protein
MEEMNMFGKKKGQAVMEYLITYGLALFVILIVLAILVAVVLPSLKAPETCQFTQPGFTCNQKPHTLVADSGNNVRMLFQLDNAQGKSVVVKGVLCSVAPPGNVRKTDIELLASERPLASGESVTIGGPNAQITDEAECKNEDGTTVKLAPNSNFRGSLGVLYRFSEDQPDAPDRLAVATVSGTVQAE